MLNDAILGVTFETGKEETALHPTSHIVPFSVSVLAVVTNEVETAIFKLAEWDIWDWGLAVLCLGSGGATPLV